jgi:hypothetical protein
MKCYYCKTELIKDFLGTCCPNEKCGSIDGTIQIEISPEEKRWYKNGLLHREDGPAIERSNGTKFWYIKDNLYREDGPAVESNKISEWFQYGANGIVEHWVNGKKIE